MDQEKLKKYQRMLEDSAKDTFWDFLGCEMISLNTEETIISLQIKQHHKNPIGILHGGVSATLLDNVMAISAMVARPEQKIVTTNLNIHFVCPLEDGRVLANGKVLHQSHKSLTVHGEVTDEKGNLIALATGSYRIIG